MEVYSVDIRSSEGLLLYGASGDMAEIYDYRTGHPISRVDGFGDSVAHVKFTPDGRLFLVALDGGVLITDGQAETLTADVEDEVTAAWYGERILIGTKSGRIFIYTTELEHVNTLGGHDTEILDLCYSNGLIFSLSTRALTVQDELGRPVSTARGRELTAFKHIAGEFVALAGDSTLGFWKGSQRIFSTSTPGPVESMELIGTDIVAGGNFDHLILLDTSHHYALSRIPVPSGVTCVKRHGEHSIVFSTVDDRIGIVDKRNGETLQFYDPGVGTIFDFVSAGSDIVVGGQKGLLAFTTEAVPYSLEQAAANSVALEDLSREPEREEVGNE